MSLTEPAPPPIEIPESFFSEARTTVTAKMEAPRAPQAWQPQKAQLWYDHIIDWMFANPGGKIRDCAEALGKSPVTIGLIVRSDLFRARYAQRRARFSDDLDHRLVGKLARVAELSLDSMADALEKKRDQVPLPVLSEISSKVMDRLGYGPSRSDSTGTAVQVNVHTAAPETVSPAALARARGYIRTIEGKLAEGGSEAPPPSGPRVEEL